MLNYLLTVVIPCTDGTHHLENLLNDLNLQKSFKGTRVIVSTHPDDNESIGTVGRLRESKSLCYPVIYVPGGTVAQSRNAGLKHVSTNFVLFINDNTRLLSDDIILRSIRKIRDERLELVTCPVKSVSCGIKPFLFSSVIRFEKMVVRMIVPFASGEFFLTRTGLARKKGGFDQDILHSSDFALSCKYSMSSFGSMDECVGLDRSGHTNYRYFLDLILNRNNPEFFKHITGYQI
jgi:hypothetical protein